jgi:hypothetical protein
MPAAWRLLVLVGARFRCSPANSLRSVEFSASKRDKIEFAHREGGGLPAQTEA